MTIHSRAFGAPGPPGPPERPRGGLAAYIHLSRTLTYGVLFALPLFFLYEALVVIVNRVSPLAVRNAADALLRGVFTPLGARGELAFLTALILVAALLVLREQRRHPVPLRGRVFVAMAAESGLWAVVFWLVVSRVTGVLLSPLARGAVGGGASAMIVGQEATAPSFAQMIALSLGAGLYEELVFRVLLVSALAWLFRRVLASSPIVSGMLAVVASALVFSAFHYVGPLGDAWDLGSFTFRFIGGLAFSTIFLLRGFGIVAWTHALYDVFLLTATAVAL